MQAENVAHVTPRVRPGEMEQGHDDSLVIDASRIESSQCTMRQG